MNENLTFFALVPCDVVGAASTKLLWPPYVKARVLCAVLNLELLQQRLDLTLVPRGHRMTSIRQLLFTLVGKMLQPLSVGAGFVAVAIEIELLELQEVEHGEKLLIVDELVFILVKPLKKLIDALRDPQDIGSLVGSRTSPAPEHGMYVHHRLGKRLAELLLVKVSILIEVELPEHLLGSLLLCRGQYILNIQPWENPFQRFTPL